MDSKIQKVAGKRMLLLGQLPPPVHGQAVATQMLFEHDWNGIEVKTLQMAYSTGMDEVGRFAFRKILHLFSLVRKTRKILKENPRTTLFYPPGSASWIPFLRDVVFLALTRKHAAATVFIFHAGGLAAFVTQSPLRRGLGRLAYGKPDLAFEVALEEVPPREAFQARSWQWCPCAMDVQPMSRPVRERGSKLKVLFVGSLQEGKGILEIVKTATWLKKLGQDSDFEFLVVGKWYSDSFKSQTEQMVKEQSLEEVVKFPGEVTGDEKWDLYERADIFFFPSHYGSEASPIVLMEALGAGLPIITTRWRGIPKMLQGCESAEILPVHRPELYGQALVELSNRRQDFPKLSEASREFYEGRYQNKHYLGRIEASLHKMWSGHTGSLDPTRTSLGLGDDRDKIRVLQVFNQYSDQGGEEVWVEQMSKLGSDQLQIDELRFQSRSWKVRGAPSLWQQVRLIWNNPEARHRLEREVDSVKPDALVYHNTIPIASFGIYQEAQRLGVPLVQYIHNFRPFSPSGTLWSKNRIVEDALKGNRWKEVMGKSWEGSYLKTGLMAYYLDRLDKEGWLDAVSHWIAVSDFMRDKFIEAGIAPEKITTLRHCWQFDPNQSQSEDGDYYLFLGRLVPEKGIWILVEVWEQLRRELGEECPKLVIAGTGSAERDLKNRIKDNSSIEMVGFVSGQAKRKLINGSRAVLAPSVWWEPLGLIVYDGYEFFKPVLAARSGGLTETVTEGVTGYLHDPDDVAQFCINVRKIEEMGIEGRRTMGMAGRKWLEENADPERWRVKFTEILSKAGVPEVLLKPKENDEQGS